MNMQRQEIQEVRKRLKEGKLTEEDVKLLNQFLDGAEMLAGLETTEGGKKLVAHLPFGMDIVK